MSNPALKYSLLLGLLLLLVGSVTVFQNQELFQELYAFLRHDIHPGLFIALMALLPVIGIPLSPFLVLSGIKFGTPLGVILTLCTVPVHLALCYLISNTIVQRQILKIIYARGYTPPAFFTNKPGKLVLLFLVMPGPPYVVKNYLLAMTGLPFLSYLGLTWFVQSILALPVVVLGGAASQHRWGLFAAVLALLMAVSLGMHWYKMKWKAASPEDIDQG